MYKVYLKRQGNFEESNSFNLGGARGKNQKKIIIFPVAERSTELRPKRRSHHGGRRAVWRAVGAEIPTNS